MLFSSQLPLSDLIFLCRALRHGLGAGLSLVQVFSTQAERGPTKLRHVAGRIRERLDSGEALEDALKPEAKYFPPLFLDIAGLGEQTGQLTEIFGMLEHYYRQQQILWKQFVSQITWPVFQFCAAVGVIALLLLILGWIAESNGGTAFDPFGFGTGVRGSLNFLGSVAVFLALLFALYKYLPKLLKNRSAVDRKLLSIPVLGPCLDALAMQRFCLALRATMESGMSVRKSLALSLKATNNSAFIEPTQRVVGAVKAGRPVTDALAAAGVFSPVFMQVMHVAEESGQIPEVMAKQADHYQEEASIRLKALTQGAAFGVWLFVAILIIWAIFRIASIYFGAINSVM
jgi:type II secretory pathway component PulF